MSTEISTSTTPARGLALATMDDAWRFWQMVAKTDFAPKDFKNKPEACLLAGQHGAELGLGPMQSLQCIAVINGRPSIWGDAALALVQSSAVCEYVVEELEEGKEGETLVAICTAKRRGYPKPTVVRFSVADAKKAGLWGKSGPWTQYPKRMLQLRARGFALRDAFPDVLKGLVTAEEAQDYPTEAPAAVALAQEPAKATQVAQPPAASQPSVIKNRPTPKAAIETPEERARAACSRATSLEQLDGLRTWIDKQHVAGHLDDAQVKDLVALLHGKAEILIGNEERGQEFAHEAAEHEVTA